jgi:DHA2 family multidrug resistance protein
MSMSEKPVESSRGTGPARTPRNPWVIAIAVSLTTFMEVLDTSIANVASRQRARRR